MSNVILKIDNSYPSITVIQRQYCIMKVIIHKKNFVIYNYNNKKRMCKQ